MEEEKSDVHEEKKIEEPEVKKNEKPVEEKQDKVKEHKIEKQEHSKTKENLTDKMRENPWIVSTLVLGILSLILLVGNFSGGVSGNVISEDDAGSMILDLVKAQGANAELIDVVKESGLYKITFSAEDETSSVYTTLDGENLVNGLIPISVLTQQQDSQQQESEDWSVFENELPENVKSKILSFNYEESEVYDEELKINEFKNYDFIPNTLIVFYNSGCGACRGYFPVLVEVKEKYPEINIYALNSGQNRDFTEKYDMNYVPTTIINLKYKIVGGNSLESLSEILDELNK